MKRSFGFRWRVAAAAIGMLAGGGAGWAQAGADPVRDAIVAAGNAEDEAVRLRLLQALRARPGLDDGIRADLDRLLPVVTEWVEGKTRSAPASNRAAENGYLCRFITGAVQPAASGNPIHPAEMRAGSPLRPLWCYYRGRMLVWRVVQSGPLLAVKESREAYYGEASRLLAEAAGAFPENRVIRMYLGQPMPWPALNAAATEAPAWANLQREGLEKLTWIIRWWIAERQLADGQFGGGWGDDVEMWRWWAPILIGFDNPEIAAAQEKLSQALFDQPHLRDGFTQRMTDVEHSNEDTTDTIVPMMHVKPDDPVWSGRALRLAELMSERWTGRNARGFTQFKSIYFSVSAVDESPRRAFDTVYHASIVQPALLYWQRTHDAGLTAQFGDWLRGWIDAAERAEHGKPAGILPSAIAWPSGEVAGGAKSWWEPFPLNHNDRLYNWPGATGLMAATLLQAWHITRDARFMDPLHAMAAIRMKHSGAAADATPGSEAWAASRMDGFLAPVLAKYRFLSGDKRYDAWLRSGASGYVRFRLEGERRALERGLQQNAEAFRSNREGYTSEMRWTDRVMNFTSNYLVHLPVTAPPRPAPLILYSSVTGDPGGPLIFPLNAVRWLTPSTDMAALVTDSSARRFEAELFHFGSDARAMGAELLLLEPGEYRVTLTPADTGVAAGTTMTNAVTAQTLRVTGPRSRIAFELPSRRLYRVTIEPAKR